MLGELSPREIEQLLQSEMIARLGCHLDGRTYVVPITYAYADGGLLWHSKQGLKLEMLRRNPKVCVQVDHVDSLVNWRSVIAWGEFEELKGPAAEHAMAQLRSRFLALTLSETRVMPSKLRSSETHERGSAAPLSPIYRILLTEKTGRFERGA